jgi:outer membrane receptor for ferrienterochelin and colicin
MARLDTRGIERIEVLAGGGSALYGDAAVGATVNALTKSAFQNRSKKLSRISEVASKTKASCMSTQRLSRIRRRRKRLNQASVGC